ncbi:type 1 glutamine amidotransferase [Vibrio sp. WXL103]|uniref:type 1 glutamine amidotransferase n=1 Tax=unclassified Vibrio TaxID=2614977 RepID=UPI003EC4C77A
MKIGILTCGYVDSELAKTYGQYAQMIELSLGEIKPTLEFINYDAYAGELPDLDECFGFILTGSVHNAYDNDAWITNLMDWVVRCEAQRKPLVGICFGHQLIARALGGRVEKSTKGWGIGSYEVNIIRQKRWMKLGVDSARVLVSHQDQVVIAPSGMKVAARNDFCPNFMLVKDNHVMTIQGHPEFSSSFTQALTRQREHLLRPGQCQSALAEASKPQDSSLILHWISSFFETAVRDQQVKQKVGVV